MRSNKVPSRGLFLHRQGLGVSGLPATYLPLIEVTVASVRSLLVSVRWGLRRGAARISLVGWGGQAWRRAMLYY